MPDLDGDPDLISAGTAGGAALWGESSAAVGMVAIPSVAGAHQAGRGFAGRAQLASGILFTLETVKTHPEVRE